MPLHADKDGLCRALDRFDRAVIGPRDCREVTCQALDGLVMVGWYVSLLPAEHLVEQAVRRDSDKMPRHRARCRAVLLMADDIGEVLDERAAVSDIQQLHSPADGEHRQT